MLSSWFLLLTFPANSYQKLPVKQQNDKWSSNTIKLLIIIVRKICPIELDTRQSSNSELFSISIDYYIVLDSAKDRERDRNSDG